MKTVKLEEMHRYRIDDDYDLYEVINRMIKLNWTLVEKIRYEHGEEMILELGPPVVSQKKIQGAGFIVVHQNVRLDDSVPVDESAVIA